MSEWPAMQINVNKKAILNKKMAFKIWQGNSKDAALKAAYIQNDMQSCQDCSSIG